MNLKDQLIAVRDRLQSLLDTYQIRDPGMVDFKSALVDLQTAIDLPAPAPEVINQPVVGTQAVVDGVLTGLVGLVGQANATASDVATVLQACGELRGVLVSVESDTARLRADTTQLRADSAQIISNTTPTAA